MYELKKGVRKEKVTRETREVYILSSKDCDSCVEHLHRIFSK